MHANLTMACAAGFAVRTLICKKIGDIDDKTGMDAVWGSPPGVERTG
jgi:hypothetical protein